MEATIRKGIPMPERNYNKAHRPWGQMEVGDCVDISDLNSSAASNYANAFGRQKHPRRKFSARVVNENGVKIVRVWRTE